MFHLSRRYDIKTMVAVLCLHRQAVPLVPLPTVSRRAFLVSGATTWNDLPFNVTSARRYFTNNAALNDVVVYINTLKYDSDKIISRPCCRNATLTLQLFIRNMLTEFHCVLLL